MEAVIETVTPMEIGALSVIKAMKKRMMNLTVLDKGDTREINLWEIDELSKYSTLKEYSIYKQF